VRRVLFGPLVFVVAVLATGPVAYAVPDCPDMPRASVVASGQGRLESIASDSQGRLFFTDVNQNRLLRLDAPGARAKVLAADIPSPGGLAWDPSGDLIVGYNGAGFFTPQGNAMSGLYRVNPETGQKRAFASEFDQANGLARSRAGDYYTSNVADGEIVRVSPAGAPSHWTTIPSANGLAVDPESRYLYVATSIPAKVVRVELADPTRTKDLFDASQSPEVPAPDGLTTDSAGRLFVAANGAGQIWRIEGEGQPCAVAKGLAAPSNVAFGGGRPGAGFSARNLYAVTFTGDVVELAGAGAPTPPATPAPPLPPATPAALELTARPRATRALKTTKFRVHVTASGVPVEAAKVMIGRARALTDSGGNARLTVRFTRPGRRAVRASKRGYVRAVDRVTVRRPAR
jgi:sugar lactone lactonase YvrE